MGAPGQRVGDDGTPRAGVFAASDLLCCGSGQQCDGELGTFGFVGGNDGVVLRFAIRYESDGPIFTINGECSCRRHPLTGFRGAAYRESVCGPFVRRTGTYYHAATVLRTFVSRSIATVIRVYRRVRAPETSQGNPSRSDEEDRLEARRY